MPVLYSGDSLCRGTFPYTTITGLRNIVRYTGVRFLELCFIGVFAVSVFLLESNYSNVHLGLVIFSHR